jgi:stage III sporulation protein SpoIIIAA
MTCGAFSRPQRRARFARNLLSTYPATSRPLSSSRPAPIIPFQMTPKTLTDDLDRLVAVLPAALEDALQAYEPDTLLEIVMDLGRPPQARFPGRAAELSSEPITRHDLDHVVAAIGRFTADNRAGIEGTLHRISALRNRKGDIIGLTLRVGRAVYGTIEPIRDLVARGSSILLLGKPGIGKTTKLREAARLLADELGKRVIVVDTSNEIAGDGDVPHPAIGGARRMQVPHPTQQHAVMIEAVENHMPEVVIVDEIGTEAEAMAARTIAERGVQLIGTAHGTSLENLLRNPTLSDLVGGVQTVTLGDEEARLRGTQKTVSERRAPPTFDAVVEIRSYDDVTVHHNTAKAVDALLRGGAADRAARGARGGWPTKAAPRRDAHLGPERGDGSPQHALELEPEHEHETPPVRIYPYAVSRDAVERVIRELRLEARTVSRPERADAVVALRGRADDVRLQRILGATGLPLRLVKKGTTSQLRRLLRDMFAIVPGADDEEVAEALEEAQAGVRRAMEDGVTVELAPRPPRLRRLQHREVSRHQMVAESVGSEPERRLVIRPD